MADTAPAPAAAPRKKKPLWRRITRALVVLFLIWFLGGGIAALLNTRRVLWSSPEPPPAVSWGTLDSVRLKTSDGQEIGGWIDRAGSKPTIILCLHGVGDTREYWLPIMQRLAEAGYASMAISFRAHGDSTGRIEDFGYSDSKDVVAAVSYLRQQFPGRPIALVGNSMGSAAAIFAAGSLDHQVAGYFLESPYRDLATAVKNRTDFAPWPINRLAYAGMTFWGRALLPENADVISPIENVGKIPADVPITFVAADKDRACQIWEVRDLFEKAKSHARLVVIDSSRHAAASRTHATEYYAALFDLLHKTDARDPNFHSAHGAKSAAQADQRKSGSAYRGE